MNMTYEDWKTYKECPKKYFLFIRKGMAPTAPQNDYFRLYGLLIQSFFQHYSNIWRYKTPYMPPDFIQAKLKTLYEQLLETTQVDWNGRFVKGSKEDIYNEVYRDVCIIMDSPNQNYFLNTRANLEIAVDTQTGIRITHPISFLHKNLDESVLIFEGRGSSKVKKKEKGHRLLFYALLYYMHFKKIPEQLAYFYYRYNTLAPFPYDLTILNEFRAMVSKDMKDMMALSHFPANPCTNSCKYCPYNNSCEDRSKWQANRRKASTIEAPEEIGVINLGF